MTKNNGYIGSLVIAGFFGLLLAAAWLPSSQDHGDSRKIVDSRDFHHLLAGHRETARRETARKAEEPRHMMVVGTATPAGVSEPMPQIIPPQYKEAQKGESKQMDLSWLKSFFFDIHITDLALVVFVGLIWWNSVSTRRSGVDSATAAQTRELTRAAASMEKMAKAMTAMSAMAAVTAAANAAEPAPRAQAQAASAPVSTRGKPGRPRKKAAKGEPSVG